MIFASLTMLVMLCAPALAQSSPSPSQYEPETCSSSSGACNSSVGDSPEDFVDNAEQGTDAVNDAMEGDSSPADASAVSDEAPASGGSVSPDGRPAGDGTGGPGEITRLPETGGAPLMVLGSGVALATLGLLARKVVGQ